MGPRRPRRRRRDLRSLGSPSVCVGLTGAGHKNGELRAFLAAVVGVATSVALTGGGGWPGQTRRRPAGGRFALPLTSLHRYTTDDAANSGFALGLPFDRRRTVGSTPHPDVVLERPAHDPGGPSSPLARASQENGIATEARPLPRCIRRRSRTGTGANRRLTPERLGTAPRISQFAGPGRPVWRKHSLRGAPFLS